MGPPYVVVECFATWLRTVVWKVGKVPKERVVLLGRFPTGVFNKFGVVSSCFF